MQKLKKYLFVVVLLGQFAMQAQNPTAHIEHFNNGPDFKPCFLGWPTPGFFQGAAGHDFTNMTWDSVNGAMDFSATTHLTQHSPMYYKLSTGDSAQCAPGTDQSGLVDISKAGDRYMKIRIKASTPFQLLCYIQEGNDPSWDYQKFSNSVLVMNLTTEYQEFILSDILDSNIDFTQVISLQQIGAIAFELGRTDGINFDLLTGATVSIDFIEFGSNAAEGGDPCAYFNGKVKLKQSIACTRDKATYEVFTQNAKLPVQYNWLSTATTVANGDTSMVELAGGTHAFAVSDADNCKDTVSFVVPDAKSTLGIDFEPFYVAGNFRTGFTRTNWVEAKNTGCTKSKGKLFLVLDSTVSFVSGLGTYDAIKGDTLIWNLDSLNLDATKFLSTFSLNTSLFTQIGDTVCIKVWIESDQLDEDLANNIKTYCLPIINGYDPNDIAVNPSACVEGFIKGDDLLTYKIRFQNTGNAEAININVYDTLSKHLDLSTFKVVSSSHEGILNTYMHNDSVAQFAFDNIWLKDSTTNEPQSHGYVIYQIKPKSSLPLGTVISSKADIYFDFNPSVVTNTAISTITDHIPDCRAKLVSTADINALSVRLYPNPSDGGGLTIETNKHGQLKAVLYDISGKSVCSASSVSSAVKLDCTLKSGVYFVKLTFNDSESVVEKLIVR
jgi:uncharacterized repeat protein (TIGR01451 family)